MANCVFNTIKITGKNEDIEKYLSDANKYENGTIRFSSWIPVPETFIKYDTTNYPNGEGLEIGKPFPFVDDNAPIVTQELIDEYKAATKLQMEQYGVVGWYDYNCKTYGCKWDSGLEIKSQYDGELTLYCNTPWSPPINFFLTMSERYPELSFKVDSDSVESGFGAVYLLENGSGTVLESGEYYDGVYIRDDEKLRILIRKTWLWLRYNCIYRPKWFLSDLLLKLRKTEPDDELPF